MISIKEKANEKKKDSGIVWLKEIPDSWSVKKGKYVYQIETGKKDANEGDEDGLYNFFTCSMFSKKINTYAFDCEALLVAGNGIVGYTQYYKGKFDAYQRTYVLSNFKNIDPIYLNYYTNVNLIQDVDPKKVGSVIQFIKLEDLQNFPICFPPEDEQQKIANFLDSKCQKIDDTIEKINKQIEVLKKYKQSLITEVVTKGLDKNVEMKESGVEWIGKICSNWEIGKIGYYYEIKLGKMVDSNIYDDNEMCNYLCAANIKWGGVDVSVNKKMKFTKEEQTQYLLKDGDVLITEGGSVGTACIYHDEFLPCYIQNSVHRCRGKNGNVTKFLYYWMNAVDYLEYILSICNKATIMHYTEEKLKKTPIIVMPIVMQQKIVDYLDNKCSKIDSIINKKSKQIDILERYKKSLIYEYVTGKKRV